MSALLQACLAYLGTALPSSTLGQLWPSMRLSFGEPVGALGVLLAFGVTASVVASAATGRILSRVPSPAVLAVGTMLSALALAAEAAAPALWVFAAGMVTFGLGFGAIDSALNAHAAAHFGARDINWMHASYGLGATIGPLLVTALLAGGLGWRWPYASMSAALAALGCVFILARRGWRVPPRGAPGAAGDPTGSSRPGGGASGASGPGGNPPGGPGPGVGAPSGSGSGLGTPGASGRGAGAPGRSGRGGAARRESTAAAFGALVFAAVETGIESGAGIWGYLFLTAGRGLSHQVAGVALAAYWAMMFAGRAVLGPVAERAGPRRVLAGAVAGVPAGATLMALPGPGFVAVAGLMAVGLAAAPIFPLFTLTTRQRTGADHAARTTRMVSLQVAASAVGSAVLPAGLGLAIEAAGARVVAPSLLVLGVAMGGVYALASRGRPAGPRVRPPR